MNDFQSSAPRLGDGLDRLNGLVPSIGSWSPAPGIVDAYRVAASPEAVHRSASTVTALSDPSLSDPALSDPALSDPVILARTLAAAPHERIAVADLEIDSIEALAEAEYLCAVADLRSLAKIESGLAALKARVIERLDSASTRLGIVSDLDPWQQEILAISTTAELCAALSLPPRSGGELKAQSVSLVNNHPDTLAALSSGSISWRNAVVALDQFETLETMKNAAGIQTISAADLLDFEHRLLDLAPGMTTAKFLIQARRLRERTHPDSIHQRHISACEDRKLVLLSDKDGMSWLSMFLPADTAQGIWNQATRTARTCQGPNEDRTLTQLRVDVLANWLLETGADLANEHHEDGPAQGGCPRPRAQVLVTIPVLSLLGHSNEPAELEGYGPIPPLMARKLAAECPTLYRIMVDPYTNEYLSMDPTRYRVKGAERTMLRARDGTCVFTGCNTVTDDTELDHILAWEVGGTSVPENLKSECGVHHRLKHFKDGKTKDGSPRRLRRRTECGQDQRNTGHTGARSQGTRTQEPQSAIMQGWTPTTTENANEKPGWISPAGYLYPPEAKISTPPLIPAWIMIDAIEELRSDR